MQKLVKRISLVMVALMTVFTALSYVPAKAATVIPKLTLVGAQKTEYTVGDRVQFTVNAPNYPGKIQYRAVLYNSATKTYKDLWNTADKYYTGWVPSGPTVFTIGWPMDEPGTYRITVYAKRAYLANSKTALKGSNCDTVLPGIVFTVAPKAAPVATVDSIAPVADVTVNEGETPVLPTEVTLNLSDKTTKTAKVTWGAVDTTKVGTVAVEGTVEGTELKAKVNVVVKAVALAVKSLTQINAKQLQVVFNKKVDVYTAESVANYYKNGTALTSPDSASLQDDEKTVIITLGTALTNNTAYAFKVSGVKDANGVAMASAYITSILASDTTAPAYVSASAKAKATTNTITLTFSEPIDISVASVTVNGVFASLSAGSEENEVTVTTGTNLVAGTSYSLSLMNFKDYAGNYIATNPLAATVTVVTDIVAPNLLSAVFTRDSRLELTFDKAMNLSTFTTGANVKLFDTNLSATGITYGTVTSKDSTNTVIRVAITGLPFNTANVFSGIVALTSSITDASGNALVATTRNVSVTKDTTKPQVVSAVYKNVASYGLDVNSVAIPTPHGAIVVKFNETIAVGAANTAYIIVDNKGNTISAPAISAVSLNYDDPTELVLALAADVDTTVASSYLVLVPTSAATDKAITPNASVASNQIVDVTSGAPVASDTVAPSVSGVVATCTSAAAVKTIAVTFVEAGSGLDLTTVVNTNNYRLDGAPLPSGSYITYASNVATINIPAGLITEDKTAPAGYVFNVTNIKDKAGNVMTAYVGNITLKDDVKPVFNAASINANGSVSLGFSEDVNSVVARVANTSAGTAADFVITINGITLASTEDATHTAAYAVVNGTGSDSGKYVVTVSTSVLNNDSTYGDVKYIDANGNGSYDAGIDIVVSQQASAGTDYVAGIYNLNNASSLTIATASTPTVTTDVSSFANVLTGGTTITVK